MMENVAAVYYTLWAVRAHVLSLCPDQPEGE